MRLPALAAVIAASGAVGWFGVPVAAANPAKCADLAGVVDGSRMCQIRDTSRGYALNKGGDVGLRRGGGYSVDLGEDQNERHGFADEPTHELDIVFLRR